MILNHEALFPEDKEEEDQEDLDLENIDPDELKVCNDCIKLVAFELPSSIKCLP